MHERESFGVFASSIDDEAGDLHDLAMAASTSVCVLSRGLEMVLGFCRVIGDAGHHGTQSVGDRVHVATLRWNPYSALTDAGTVSHVQIGLLGGLEVRDAGNRDIAVPSGKQQALLALLAVQAGRVVPSEQVVDALWGEEPPPQVRNGLQALASKLRSALGATGLVVMRGGGYALELPPDAVDIHRYEKLVTAARGRRE